MAWQRSGDTGATYPPLMAVRGDSDADERSVNEVGGFLWRLSMQSGAHLTDYVLDLGTIEMVGGPRTEQLLRHCTRHGLLTRVRTKHGVGYTLINDPDFIHLRLKAEVERERQQRADTQDVGLVVPIRKRDGDWCRWCGITVIWPGKKTKRSGEYDHIDPDGLGDRPTTVDEMFVACRGCNRARGGNRVEWDSSHVLRPAPAVPYYGPWTAQFLTDNGYPTSPSSDAAALAPALGADHAPAGVRSATGLGDSAAAAPDAAGETPATRSPNSSARSAETGVAGSGRVGPVSGSDGSGEGRGSGGGRGGGRRRGRRGGKR